jgi:hypothetical protein
MIAKKKNKIKSSKKKKLSKAMEDFNKLKMEIEPFIRRKKVKQISTAGRWKESDNLIFQK